MSDQGYIDYFEVLGLPHDAKQGEVRNQYKRKMRDLVMEIQRVEITADRRERYLLELAKMNAAFYILRNNALREQYEKDRNAIIALEAEWQAAVSSGRGDADQLRRNFDAALRHYLSRYMEELMLVAGRDEECVEAMLSICDARFVDALAAEAKSHGKLRADFVVPEAWRRHRPEVLAKALAPLRKRGLMPTFPFGSDFTEVEQRLLPALGWLKANSRTWRGKWRLLRAVTRPGGARANEREALARMGLEHPASLADRLQRRLLQAALRQAGN